MIWMEAVALPRIVAKHHGGPHSSDYRHGPFNLCSLGPQLAVDLAKPVHGRSCAEGFGGSLLFGAAPLYERTSVRGGIPGSLGPISAHEEMNLAATGRPPGKRCARPKFDVIGVRSDCERAGGD
jgi:hypothetical protein